MKKKCKQNGFTLIELIVYVAFLIVFMMILAAFSIDLINSYHDIKSVNSVQENSRILRSKISQEIKTAREIISLETEKIVFKNQDNIITTIEYREAEKAIYIIKETNETIMSHLKTKVYEFEALYENDIIKINLGLESGQPARRPGIPYRLLTSLYILPRPSIY